MHIAIIGCGNMGTGLAEQLSPFHHTFLYSRDWHWTQELALKVQGEACQHLEEAIDKVQLIFLAIKPENLKEIAPLMQPHLRKDQMIVSLLAGTPLAILRHYFPNSILFRMMPNLAMCYGAGIIGLAAPSGLTSDLKEQLENLLTPLGLIYWLEENKMDALTSLASSGPAFVLTLIEAMIEAGIAMGFQAKEAQELIIQMLQGCLTLMQKTGKHPAELKCQIASPNGTTIAGLRVLERANLRSGLIETFLATQQRAQEIAKSHDRKEFNDI